MATPMDNGYVMVAERHAAFVKDHPNGRIETELSYAKSYDNGTGLVVVKASVWKDRATERYSEPDGTGMASMPIPGPTPFTKNSEVENAETSAIGRALAAIGYHAKDTMASQDEIEMKGGKAKATTERKGGPTPKQLSALSAMGNKHFGDDKQAMHKFVLDTTGKHKRTELTQEDVDKLFDAFDALAKIEGMDAGD